MKGIGHDLIEIERIRHSFERHGQSFLKKILTSEECEYCLKHNDSVPHIAGRFAAKEAISKALGTGIGKDLAFSDISIINNELGKPIVSFSSKAREIFNNPDVLLSISHSQHYASAFAIWN